jgi:hypothetical protein
MFFPVGFLALSGTIMSDSTSSAAHHGASFDFVVSQTAFFIATFTHLWVGFDLLVFSIQTGARDAVPKVADQSVRVGIVQLC